MYLEQVKLSNHPILGNLTISLLNEKTGKPYKIIVFVGENGCGKTTLLNEIFNYNNSNYIIDKKQDANYKSIFVRQDSKYSDAMNELIHKISGDKPLFPSESFNNTEHEMKTTSSDEKMFRTKNIVSLFDDPLILLEYAGDKINDIKCGGEALRLIDGSKSSIDLTKLSSGQQEVLLKIKYINKITNKVDSVLFDEPETSLHPRWQKVIVKFLTEMIKDQSNNTPQLFIATHSEKVLESLLDMDDVLIIRFYKENSEINVKPINRCQLFLPKTTFAELDFVIFNISTYDYHDQLFTFFGDLLGSDSVGYIDKRILKNNLYKPEFFKKWEGIKKVWNKQTKQHESVPSCTATLPCYIRNYFHHPKKDLEPSEKELTISILFLQELIKNKKIC